MALSNHEIEALANAVVTPKDRSGVVALLVQLSDVTKIRDAADDAAAAALSPPVPVGGLYRSTSTLKIRVS